MLQWYKRGAAYTYLYKRPFLEVKDLTYLTFVNTQNLHFRAKTCFFTFFEKPAFI